MTDDAADAAATEGGAPPDSHRVVCTACRQSVEIDGPQPTRLPYPCYCETELAVVAPDGERLWSTEERALWVTPDRVVDGADDHRER